MTTFDSFFPDQRALHPEPILARGWAARPFPEMAGEEEIREIANLCGVAEVTLWAWEFGRPAKQTTLPDIEIDMQPIVDSAALNQLLAFGDQPLMLWQDEEHAYFVLFGAPKLLDTITASEIFDYSFDDYVAEPYFQGPKADHLRGVQQAYTLPAPAVQTG